MKNLWKKKESLNENEYDEKEMLLNDEELLSKNKNKILKISAYVSIAVACIGGGYYFLNSFGFFEKVENPKDIENSKEIVLEKKVKKTEIVKKELKTANYANNESISENEKAVASPLKIDKTENAEKSDKKEKEIDYSEIFEKVSPPEKISVKKQDDGKIKIILENKNSDDIKKIKKELKAYSQMFAKLISKIDAVESKLNKTELKNKEVSSKIDKIESQQKKYIKDYVDTNIKNITIRLEKELSKIKSNYAVNVKHLLESRNKTTSFVQKIESNISNNNKKIKRLEYNLSDVKAKITATGHKIATTESKISDIESKITKLETKMSAIQDSLKNINKNTIAKLEKLVYELREKSENMKKINEEMEKIKKIFQDNIKTNIEFAKQFDELRQTIAKLKSKIKLLSKSKTNIIPVQKNKSETASLTKRDYIDNFGFYYAGYSEDGNVPTGYISDVNGKIYEVKAGDIVNNRYKIFEIKPLYLKLKDIVNGKEYIVSYKQ